MAENKDQKKEAILSKISHSLEEYSFWPVVGFALVGCIFFTFLEKRIINFPKRWVDGILASNFVLILISFWLGIRYEKYIRRSEKEHRERQERDRELMAKVESAGGPEAYWAQLLRDVRPDRTRKDGDREEGKDD